VTRAGWVIAFLAPCGAGRVNDKKVNEENSSLKNKGPGQVSENRSGRSCIQQPTSVGYNIPRLKENYKSFFRFFTKRRPKKRIFGETHKFSQKFPAN
jgi:hypothetical protein